MRGRLRPTWLLWLLIALLPLRVLGHAAMAGLEAPKGAHATLQVLTQDATPGGTLASALPPCHAGAAGSAADADAAGQEAGPSAGCPACALCHAGVALPAVPGTPSPEPCPAARPDHRPTVAAGLPPPEGIFRPPRG